MVIHYSGSKYYAGSHAVVEVAKLKYPKFPMNYNFDPGCQKIRLDTKIAVSLRVQVIP